MSLPTYPFEHARYWIDPGKSIAEDGGGAGAPLAKSDDISDWFYQPAWLGLDLPAGVKVDPPVSEGECWIVFVDRLGLGARVADQLRARKQSVITVSEGREFARRGPDAYVIRAGERADYDALFQQLSGDGKRPSRVVHLWAVPTDVSRRRLDHLAATQDRCFYSLLFLAQALANHEPAGPFHIIVVSSNVHQVRDEPVQPEKALIVGPCSVIPREFPRIHCRNIDLALGPRPRQLKQQAVSLVDQLLIELAQKTEEPVVAYRENRRWVQRYEAVALPAAAVSSDRLRAGGVYLITGGLGGLALVHAEYLAKSLKAKLVLVARTALPPRDTWDLWLKDHADSDPVSEKITRVRALEAHGSEVLVCAADVTDLDGMRRVVASAQNRFGSINGVIHAAGTMDDGLIQLKTRETADPVLGPKVRGTLVLEAALSHVTLDFFVVFSSTSSILGPAGQVDYAAANACLNAFARSKSTAGNTVTVAIDWGVWTDVGMAMAAAGRLGYVRPARAAAGVTGVDVPHPLLRHRTKQSSEQVVYETEYSAEQLWVLNEHRLHDGAALVPGTAYLEIARAALVGESSDVPVAVQDVSFTLPLQLGDLERRRVRIALQQQNDGHAFTISSLVEGPQAGSTVWQEHAGGTVSRCSSVRPANVDVAEIRARCPQVAHADGRQVRLQERHLRFGPRWQNFLSVHLGAGEGIAELALPQEFAGDLNEYGLHPALLDMATGFPLLLIDGYDPGDLYVPLSYQTVRVWKAIPQRFFSHARCTSRAQREAATFDVTLVDQNGSVLAEIEQLVVRRVADPAKLLASARPIGRNARTSSSGPSAPSLPELLQLAIDCGITPAEGVEAFSRILAHTPGPQVVASSLRLPALMRRLAAESEASESEVPKQSRPATMRDSYVAPRTDLERQIAAIWQEILGVDQVGVRDSFFDLGGHSLLAVRLFSKLKKVVGKTLPLSTLFDAPTIEQLAAQLGDTSAATPKKKFSSIVPIQPKGSKPPFFCIHGMGGNIVEYSHLARYLNPDQPFYGIQARGLDGEDTPLSRIEDCATHYITELRAVQPEGPYYLGGSSLGGLIGYEMARQLHVLGERVALLAFFDSYGRDYPKRLPTVTKMGERINAWKLRFDLHWSNLRIMSGRQRAEYVQDKTIRLGRRLSRRSMKAVDRLDRQIRMLFLPRVLREQFKMTGEDSRTVGSINIPRAIRDVQVGITQAARSYTLHPYAGPVTLFRAMNQPPDIYNDPTNGWGELVLGGLEILDVAGHHGAIVREPRVRLLAEKLNASLEAAQSASRNGRGAPRAPIEDELASVDAASLDFALIGAGASSDTAAAGSVSSPR